MVWETRPDRGRLSNVVSNANYLDWKARNQVFDAMSPVFYFTNSLLSGGEPEEIRIQMVGEDFFPMLGVKMQLGRAFGAEECKPGAPVVAVLSDLLWRTRFSGDRNIVGRTIRLGSDAATVIGVTPPDLLTISDRQPMLWRNARVSGVNSNGGRAAGRNMAVLARLKRGLSAESADRHMVGLAKQLEQEFPQFNAKWSARVSPLSEESDGQGEDTAVLHAGCRGVCAADCVHERGEPVVDPVRGTQTRNRSEDVIGCDAGGADASIAD